MDPLQAGDPSQIGDYRLLGRLGAGGMGQVYLGATPGGRLVAVKVIRAEIVEDPEYRRRFAREVQAARSVGGFHTAHVVDADPDASPPWMVTAFVAGPSLHATVRENGPLTVAAATALGAALAEAHRDPPLRPGAPRPQAGQHHHGRRRPPDHRLRHRATRRGQHFDRAGHAGWHVPVHVARAVPRGSGDPGSDVFALGCVLVFAATGHAPFEAETAYQVMYRILEEAPERGDRGRPVPRGGGAMPREGSTTAPFPGGRAGGIRRGGRPRFRPGRCLRWPVPPHCPRQRRDKNHQKITRTSQLPRWQTFRRAAP